MSVHNIKVWPPYYDVILSGEKAFEVRRDDRGYQKGDTLRLQEWDPGRGYTGRGCIRWVAYILTGGQFGIEPGYVVMGLVDGERP